ncbi:hypothetical protein KRP22_012763 [Phytophthora ramorum]|uniref:uncharacterized protein n=1 Tax=Phytophthora ramorum TaxID=164328 RepID=UPI0030B79414|nr:hypothetical protein KRP23_14986 [Phytophthora ramorum]KAH7501347.1 hypothetical protein KRP22_8808 [Phytophthora ramorum]
MVDQSGDSSARPGGGRALPPRPAPTRRDDDPGFEVCHATEDDWDRDVTSENQARRSRAMTWVNGRIYIVELPGWVHGRAVACFREELTAATGTRDRFLALAGDTYVESLEHIEPDVGFPPKPESGAVLPAGLHWAEFYTLKVGVGVSRLWTQLNNKAER